MKVVTSAAMKAIEERASQQGLDEKTLMQLAGSGLAREVEKVRKRGPVILLVGPGNNGGDGIVAAQRLSQAGHETFLYALSGRDIPHQAGPFARAKDDVSGSTLRSWLTRSAVVVDALLGTGQSRPPAGDFARTIHDVNEIRPNTSTVIAVDVPTGVEADSGRLLGDSIHADITVCMGFAKAGVLSHPGAARAGRLVVLDLGLRGELAAQSSIIFPDDRDIAGMLPQRDADSNKGTFGRVLVVGGSADFTGAPALVALGAYRTGAGLLEILVPDVVRSAVSAHVMECIFAPGQRHGDQLGPESVSSIQAAAAKARAVVVGPGMGFSDRTLALFRNLLSAWKAERPRATVVDADALNALSHIDNWWHGQREMVLTPHPGEMSRLTGVSVPDVQSDRLSIARRHAEKWGQVVVLKGARSIVAAPDGRVSINGTGGPNMATAGAGDVLSGIIGGLLAQGCEPWDAAVVGSYMHGRAGDMVGETLGEAGTLAGDLTGAVPRARFRILQAAGRI